jgi:hypothetical protein
MQKKIRQTIPRLLPDRIEFPYLKDSSGHFSPIIYLQVWTGNRWLYLQAYVDSGASCSVFHSDIAQLLGIKLSRCKKRYIALGNGSVIPIYICNIKIQFAGENFEIPAGFSDSLKIGFNLLGRSGVFDRFAMCFNDRAKILSVTPIKIRKK